LLGPVRSSAILAGLVGANGAIQMTHWRGRGNHSTWVSIFRLVIAGVAGYHCSLRQMLTLTRTRRRLSASMLIEYRDVGPRQPQPRLLPGGPRHRLHARHYHLFIAPVPPGGAGGLWMAWSLAAGEKSGYSVGTTPLASVKCAHPSPAPPTGGTKIGQVGAILSRR